MRAASKAAFKASFFLSFSNLLLFLFGPCSQISTCIHFNKFGIILSFVPTFVYSNVNTNIFACDIFILRLWEGLKNGNLK